ncbi:methyl-accepting chemotaxis protein [Natroniella sp. ANB-PHB2]|uniref:methyl-accepting chemotaxis protein n=1 Tax=Natroniella sp. ANB-PHB2 TaxID=3384444 RepID=UPI0038D37288
MADIAKELNALLTVGPLLNRFFVKDISIYISNTEKMLATYPSSELDFGVEEGDKIQPNWTITRAITSGKRLVIEEDATNFGIPYISIANPILNESGEIIGGITFNQSVDKKEELLNIANELLNFTGVVNQQVEQIAVETKDVVDNSNNLTDIADIAKERVDNTDEIINIIKDIAKQIKLIGMNASIKANKVGIEGKGFAVIAQEIQKLATNTSEATTNIEEILMQIATIIGSLDRVAKQIDQISSRQVGAVNKINEEIKELDRLGSQVVEMAEVLAGNEKL